ncbi:MAG TPA: UDP-glucose 4-epimerase GalE [Spirochaetota bacterium]|nr:UDP-glucose 4-epimerase GalE [Spirochaetota bacterium]
MTEILVTGGAGYIGSHAVRALARMNFTPVVYDNLDGGFREAVAGFEFIQGDIGDYDKLSRVFTERDIRCVMNFASYIAVGESVADPLKYYDNNVGRTIALFRAMKDAGVPNFIFSSSAAVYGDPDAAPIREESPLRPASPYGRTKYFIEEMLRDLEVSDGFRSVCLRYFNAAGADPSGDIGERHAPETHLVPLVLRAAIDPEYSITVFGRDYDTPDGTCIRDYVHVNDLADAHVLALRRLLDGKGSAVYNLGNGSGFSVLEVIESARRVTGKVIRALDGFRRSGDPARLVASSRRAGDELGWVPVFTDLDGIVETAWRWERSGKRKDY